MNKEWNKFKIGTASIDKSSFNKDCMPFDFVNHVSHVESSIEILKRQSLVAGLVFDESKLNSKRILVNWLSPNHWFNGFRYGNICFKIPFNKSVLERDYNFYWIESISYGVEACRILITKKDHDFLEKLKKYDPYIPDGPWWYDKEKDQHYYNSNFCLEFMAEKDFSIQKDTKINFVKHHSDYCSLNRSNPTACNELGDDSRVGGLKFISRVISASIKIDKRHFINDNNENIPSDDFLNAWLEFKSICNKNKSTISGKYKSDDSIAKSLARAIFNTYYYKIEDEFLNLISQFKDVDELLKCSAQLIASSFGFKDWEYIYNYEESPF